MELDTTAYQNIYTVVPLLPNQFHVQLCCKTMRIRKAEKGPR